MKKCGPSGTLDSNGTPWKELFFPLYASCGVNIEQARFDRAFYDADDNLPLRHNLKGLGLSETVKLQVADVFENLKINDTEKATEIASLFVNNCRSFFAQTEPVLKELSKAYSLGIVSNNYGNLDSMLESEGLLKYFGAVADSGVVGKTKPDPEIFLYALDRLGAAPQDAMMVGDSERRDIPGALNLGMTAALLWGDRYNHQPPPDMGERVILLRNLGELPAKLSARACALTKEPTR